MPGIRWFARNGYSARAALAWNQHGYKPRAGQTKIAGFAIDIVSGHFELGFPRLSSSAVDLFRDGYQLPLRPPELGAVLATVGEHAPYPTHGVWAAVLLWLMVRGPGVVSLDHLLATRLSAPTAR